MANIFVGQSVLRIQVVTAVDITGALSTIIAMVKPDGSEKSLSAEVLEVTTGTIYYDVQDSYLLDQAGEYYVRAVITFSDGRIGYGDKTSFRVWDR